MLNIMIITIERLKLLCSYKLIYAVSKIVDFKLVTPKCVASQMDRYGENHGTHYVNERLEH
jgi:hypothetical protein